MVDSRKKCRKIIFGLFTVFPECHAEKSVFDFTDKRDQSIFSSNKMSHSSVRLSVQPWEWWLGCQKNWREGVQTNWRCIITILLIDIPLIPCFAGYRKWIKEKAISGTYKEPPQQGRANYGLWAKFLCLPPPPSVSINQVLLEHSHACSFAWLIYMAAFTLQWQSWRVGRETLWSTKSQIFTL